MKSQENCTICKKIATSKIKGEEIYYCKDCADNFFSSDSLENIQKLKQSNLQAQKLKEFLEKQ